MGLDPLREEAGPEDDPDSGNIYQGGEIAMGIADYFSWDNFYQMLKPIFGNRRNFAIYCAELHERNILDFMYQTRQVPVYR